MNGTLTTSATPVHSVIVENQVIGDGITNILLESPEPGLYLLCDYFVFTVNGLDAITVSLSWTDETGPQTLSGIIGASAGSFFSVAGLAVILSGSGTQTPPSVIRIASGDLVLSVSSGTPPSTSEFDYFASILKVG